MGSIDRYIFRTTLASFALVLVSLTGVIWITQALRGIDLMTSQGQTIVTFLGITSLVIPALVLVISPIALMIAISHTLNKLATDSEIIVMNAAGYSPLHLECSWRPATRHLLKRLRRPSRPMLRRRLRRHYLSPRPRQSCFAITCGAATSTRPIGFVFVPRLRRARSVCGPERETCRWAPMPTGCAAMSSP